MLNIQSERLENHTARFTVEVETEKWEQAKKEAAREISKQIRIKGFRKGKAPYGMVVRTVGEAPIVEEAMEQLGNEIYREIISGAEYDPYAAGSLDDFQMDPQPTYVFSVPLMPEIELGDYRAVRVDYEEPTLTDEELEDALLSFQRQHAELEESESSVELGNRVVIDVHSEFADDPANDADDEEVDSDVPKKGDEFLHQHDATIFLEAEERRDVIPGFAQALLGANRGDTVEFELQVPVDKSFRQSVVGRTVQFSVEIKQLETATLPELTDESISELTEDYDEPLSTLDELRDYLRTELKKQKEQDSRTLYFDKVMSNIREGATLKYHEVMVSERIHDLIDDFEKQLQQSNIDLETYQSVTGVTHEDLHDQFHDEAVDQLETSLVLGAVIEAEGLQASKDEVDAEIEKTLSQFGEQSAMFRQFFDTDAQRSRIRQNLLFERLIDRVLAIGKGELLDEPTEASVSDEVETDDEQATPADEPQATVATQAPTVADDNEQAAEDDASDADADDTEE
ncbi:MAG: trigger factor [Anaerolineae bacterium]